jgi:hypothetical protein
VTPAGRPPPEKLMAEGSNGVPLKGDPSASGWERERWERERFAGRESVRGAIGDVAPSTGRRPGPPEYLSPYPKP